MKITPLERFRTWRTHLPEWVQDWLEVIIPAVQVLLIVLMAWLLLRMFKRVVQRVSVYYDFPSELLMPVNVVVRWLILSTTILLILERLGVSATVLWSAFTGFATVGAVAFFAAWSVLSNLFCAFLILTSRPFVVGDHIELLDTAEKPGSLGKVVDINLLYTTLQDVTQSNNGALLQIPNALVFQRVLRRWKVGQPVPEGKKNGLAANGGAPAAGQMLPSAPRAPQEEGKL